MKQQRAVVSLHRCEDGRQRWQRALWQGGTSPKVKRDDPLVQTQLAGDAVKRLWVQIQDGHQGGESRRSGGQEVPESPRTGGGTEEDQKGINERKRGRKCIAAVWLHLLKSITSCTLICKSKHLVLTFNSQTSNYCEIMRSSE